MFANREYITKKQINNDTPSPESIKVMVYLINAVATSSVCQYQDFVVVLNFARVPTRVNTMTGRIPATTISRAAIAASS